MSGPWMAEMADLVDAADGAAVPTAQAGDQAPPVTKSTASSDKSRQLFQFLSMIHRRNQRHLQGVSTLMSRNGQSNFNFQHESLVLIQNQKSIRVDMS